MRMTFMIVMVIFESFNNNKAHLAIAFWKTYSTAENIRVMNQHTCKYFHQDLGKHEAEIGEGAWKIISCTKIRVCPSKHIAPK